MKNTELATKIYKHVLSISMKRGGEHWDEWDDKREIDIIENWISESKSVSNSWGGTHKRFKDEWGNSDWRDTGEMGG